jgi:hypothetical protein
MSAKTKSAKKRTYVNNRQQSSTHNHHQTSPGQDKEEPHDAASGKGSEGMHAAEITHVHVPDVELCGEAEVS